MSKRALGELPRNPRVAPKDPRTKFEEWIKLTGWTYPELAARTEISRASLCRYAAGEVCPSIAHGLKLRDVSAGFVSLESWIAPHTKSKRAA